MIRALLIGVAFAVAGVLLTAWYWAGLPDQMPVHWNEHGVADNFMPRLAGVSIGPAMSLLVPLLLFGVSRLDPRKEHVRRSETALSTVAVAIAALGFGVQWLTLTAATSPTMEMDPRWIIIAVGLLFVVVGNVLGKVQSNWFIGIRTPWTLQSEKVWHKTHRVGAWSFGLGGLVAVLAALVLPASTLVWVMLPAFLGAGIVPVVYSYVAYRQLGDEAPTP